MLSNKTQKLFKHMVTFGSLTFCFPFHWNKFKNQYEMGHSYNSIISYIPFNSLRNFINSLFLSLPYICLFINMIWRLVVTILMIFNICTKPVSLMEIFLAILVINFFSITFLYSTFILGGFFDLGHGVNVLNQIFHLNNHLAAKLALNNKDEPDGIETVIKHYICLATISLTWFPVIVPLWFELSPNLFYYLRTEYIEINFLLGIGSSLGVYSDWMFVGATFIAGQMYCKTIIFWMKRLSFRPGEVNPLQQLKFQRLMLYRYFQVLQINLIDVLETIVPMFSVIGIILLITMTYAAVTFVIKMHILLSIYAIASATLFTAGGIKCVELSWETTFSSLNYPISYLRQNEVKITKHQRVFLKTFTPLNFRCSFYVITRDSSIKIFGSFVLHEVVNLLLTFRM